MPKESQVEQLEETDIVTMYCAFLGQI